jgi:pentatricopeptide repeat protein
MTRAYALFVPLHIFFSILFDDKREQGESPDEVVFPNVMTVCSHLGMVSKGEKYYEEMSKEYGIMLSDEHLSWFVDLFSRVGELDRTITVLKQRLPSSSDAVCCIMLDCIQRWG